MDEDVKWPSTRVAKGGIFNLPKVKYSKETHDFLNCKCNLIIKNLHSNKQLLFGINFLPNGQY